MTVDPKIIYEAARVLSSEKVRKFLLTAIFFVLGLVMLVGAAFSGLVSGVLGIFISPDVKVKWSMVRKSLSDVINISETTITSEIKSEIYDFMPDFSINLSKAMIEKNSRDGFAVYDSSEIEIAEKEMIKYADKLRSLTNETELSEYLSTYDGTNISFAEISDTVFKGDTGISKMPNYKDNVKSFLYARAMEQMTRCEYVYSRGSDDNGQYIKQTLNVKTPDDKTKTVEYKCYGGGGLYIPRFLAMYNAYQARETILIESDSENADEINDQIAQAIGGIPESPDEAEKYFEDAWNGTLGWGIGDSENLIDLDVFFEKRNLKSLLKESVSDGNAGVSITKTDSKLTITLQPASEKTWLEIFDLGDEFKPYIDETQSAIESILTKATIPRDQWALVNDNQTELFTCFDGLFELNSYNEWSKVIMEYGEISDETGSPEEGMTLSIRPTGTTTPIFALQGNGCGFNGAIVHDVDTENNSVTIAYSISTALFERDSGFPFTSICGIVPGDTVTLFAEIDSLDTLNVTEEDEGRDIAELQFRNHIIGYSNSSVPRLRISLSFANGDYDTEKSGTINPRLWITGFHSNLSSTTPLIPTEP